MRLAPERIRLKRVYDPSEAADGFCLLVDRLWPSGLNKSAAAVDRWMKDVAPSAELRRWYHQDLTRWDEFRRRYESELADSPATEHLRAIIRDQGRAGATLLYGARDVKRNHAVVLREVLLAGGGRRRTR